MVMKYALAVTAALSAASTVKAQAGAIFLTEWDDWVWCCYDSEMACTEACARVHQGPGEYWFDNYGPYSDLYHEQATAPTPAPVEGGEDPGDILFDVDLVNMKCRMMHGFACCTDPGVCGDPHFKTWNGEFYDYQGQCELKFISAPDFGNGVGLDIHIRTKIRNSYSFVEAAAIKIGNDVLEVGSWGEYFLNGVEDAELPAMMGGFPVGYYQRSEKEHVFDIFLGGDRRILIKNLKEWVSIHLDNPSDLDFTTSVGMMGDLLTGKRLARDGKTVIADENEFGQEWQVRPDEPQLFVSKDFEPSNNDKCILPVVDEESIAAQRRLLEEKGITREKAEAACAGMPAHKEFCIRDVLAAGDLDVAGAF